MEKIYLDEAKKLWTIKNFLTEEELSWFKKETDDLNGWYPTMRSPYRNILNKFLNIVPEYDETGNIVFPHENSKVIDLPVFSAPDGIWDRLESVLPAGYKRHATLQTFKYMTDEEIDKNVNEELIKQYGVERSDIDFAMYWHQDPGAESNINASFSLYLNEDFEGAYVKEPQIGLHNWVASFDLNSLYPHLIMQYNLSPETIVEKDEYTDEMRQLAGQASVESLLDRKLDTSVLKGMTITPNGQFFRTDKQGFLPAMMIEMYEDRKKFKKEMLKAQQDYENEKDVNKRKEIEKLIARYDNLQLAKKVSLNSAYGAMGSQYFRFYDLRQALAITQAGQLSIRWIENKLNEYLNKLLKTDKVVG